VYRLRSIPLCLTLVLAGCASTPGPTTSDADPDAPAPVTTDAGEDARALLARAERSGGREAARLRLEAAWILVRDGDAAAAGVLESLDADTLTRPAELRRLARMRARLALDAGDAGRARALLARADAMAADAGIDTDGESLVFVTRLRAELQEAAGDGLAAARNRVFLDGLLPPEARSANRRAIWRLLAGVDPATLDGARSRSDLDATLRAWVELAAVARGLYPTLEAQQADFAAWRARHPDHPALDALPPRLARLPGMIAERPRHVAVLLPLSGPLASAGRAVRDGVVAAHLEARSAGGAVPHLSFVDAHDTGARAGYLQAVDYGAELIVGPLARDAVDELADLPTLEVPVLALNTTSRERPVPGMVQFALLPEDEGAQIARRALANGAERALVIARDAPWARRVVAAFREHFEAGGGEIVLAREFTDPSDVADVVAGALLIDESEARRLTLRRTLGVPLEFEPRRRSDVDLVLAVAEPVAGRTLKPALDYWFAGDLPVYASSHIHGDGGPAGSETPLDGVRFCDMPWRLLPLPARRRFDAAWPDAGSSASTFHALGVDAWRLHAQLAALDDAVVRYSGVTGELHLDAQGRLRRELHWALMRDGRPLPLPRIAVGDPAGRSAGR
jgi:outer membrane PBP1 activator LpoA protein